MSGGGEGAGSRSVGALPRPLGIVGAACLWGTTGTAQALGPDGVSPLVVGSIRIVAGAVGLLAVGALRRSLPDRPVACRVPTWVAGAAMAAYQLLLFSGVRRTGVALGTVVGIGSTPLWAGVLGWAIRGEHPGRAWMTGTALAVAGSALLVGAGGGEADTLGLVLTAGAGLSYAVFTTAVKVLTDDGHQADHVVTASFLIGGALLLPVLATGDLAPLRGGDGMVLALWLGGASVTAAYLLFGWGITGVTVATAATLTLAEPLTAATLGIVVLDEAVTAAALVGMAAIAAGLLLVGRTSPPDQGPAG